MADDRNSDESSRRRRGFGLWSQISFTAKFTATFTLTVAVSIAATLAIENNFFESESGWEVDSSGSAVVTADALEVDVDASASFDSLEVRGDVRITGSELQFVDSDCADLSRRGEANVCYDGSEMLLSVNGDPYSALAGPSGPQGDRGEQGETGPAGPAGASAPRIVLANGAVFSSATERQWTVLGSGFEPGDVVTLLLVDPNGEVLLVSTAEIGPEGTLRANLEYAPFEEGVYVLSVLAPDRETMLATHPICADCAVRVP
jgi:hypothetical protein